MYLHELKPKVKKAKTGHGVLWTKNGIFQQPQCSIYITLPTCRQDTGDFRGCYWGGVVIMLVWFINPILLGF